MSAADPGRRGGTDRCFDYGNAETSNDDTGNGHMDAVYFGTLSWFTPCNGSGRCRVVPATGSGRSQASGGRGAYAPFLRAATASG